MSDTLSGYRRRGLRMSELQPSGWAKVGLIRDTGAIVLGFLGMLIGGVLAYSHITSHLDADTTAITNVQAEVNSIQTDRSNTRGKERLDMLEAHNLLEDSQIRDIQTQKNQDLQAIQTEIHEIVAGQVNFATDQSTIKAQLADLITQFYANSGRKSR